MRLMSMGDFYLWYCDWCDTRNLTPWSQALKSEVCCAACHKKFTAHDDGGYFPSRPEMAQQTAATAG